MDKEPKLDPNLVVKCPRAEGIEWLKAYKKRKEEAKKQEEISGLPLSNQSIP